MYPGSMTAMRDNHIFPDILGIAALLRCSRGITGQHFILRYDRCGQRAFDPGDRKPPLTHSTCSLSEVADLEVVPAELHESGQEIDANMAVRSFDYKIYAVGCSE